MTQPKGIQLRRTKGWRKPEGAVVVSRPSRWGNPFGWKGWREDGLDDATCRRNVVEAFEDNLALHDIPYPTRDEIKTQLAGHDLACWCPLDQPCHADVLLEIANRPEVDHAR